MANQSGNMLQINQAIRIKSIRQYAENQSGNKNQINQAICSQSIRQYESN